MQITEQPRLLGLDLLRGVAAYGVILAHCYASLSNDFGFDVHLITGFMGRSGVELFFALSGFLIGGILCDIPPEHRTISNYGIFLVRRWMRTLPTYYFAIFIFLACPGIFEPSPPAPPEHLINYLTFTQNVFYQSQMMFFRVLMDLEHRGMVLRLTDRYGCAVCGWRSIT